MPPVTYRGGGFDAPIPHLKPFVLDGRDRRNEIRSGNATAKSDETCRKRQSRQAFYASRLIAHRKLHSALRRVSAGWRLNHLKIKAKYMPPRSNQADDSGDHAIFDKVKIKSMRA
jgi:hypothetical protein